MTLVDFRLTAQEALNEDDADPLLVVWSEKILTRKGMVGGPVVTPDAKYSNQNAMVVFRDVREGKRTKKRPNRDLNTGPCDVTL